MSNLCRELLSIAEKEADWFFEEHKIHKNTGIARDTRRAIRIAVADIDMVTTVAQVFITIGSRAFRIHGNAK